MRERAAIEEAMALRALPPDDKCVEGISLKVKKTNEITKSV
jgi:hypothetical protein